MTTDWANLARLLRTQRQRFMVAVDATRIIHTLKSGSAPVAQGADFLVYKLAGDQPLALLRAKPHFKDGLYSGRSEWVAWLAKTQGLDLPLVPPMTPLWFDRQEELCLVQPWLESGQRLCPDVPPLGAQQRQALDGLANLGFYLGDVMQVGVWDGVPYIHDWSDLRQKGVRSMVSK